MCSYNFVSFHVIYARRQVVTMNVNRFNLNYNFRKRISYRFRKFPIEPIDFYFCGNEWLKSN